MVEIVASVFGGGNVAVGLSLCYGVDAVAGGVASG